MTVPTGAGGEAAGVPALARPSFFDGETLTAGDLAAVTDFHQQLRWLHNRGLHGWGIAVGLSATGARGDRTVRVEPGYALDEAGREVVLTAAADLPVPAVAAADGGGPAGYLLTASYPDPGASSPQVRAGTCGSAGAVRWPGEATVRWTDPGPDGGYRRGLDIVLAAVSIADCRLAADPDQGRRDAMPGAGPYLGAGTTPAGATPWRWWPASTPIGVATTVSTTAAGFRSTPVYQAQVTGGRQFDGTIAGTARSFLVDGTVQVANATATGFELRVVLSTGTAFGPATSAPFTVEDYGVAVLAFGNDPLFSVGYNGPTLCTGQTVGVYGADGSARGQFVINFDVLRVGLAAFASRHGKSVEEVLHINKYDPTSTARQCVTVNEPLTVGAAQVPLNPRDVIGGPEVLAALTAGLDWHVAWLGVEL